MQLSAEKNAHQKTLEQQQEEIGKARAALWIRENIQNYHLRKALPLRGSVDVERLVAQQMLLDASPSRGGPRPGRPAHMILSFCSLPMALSHCVFSLSRLSASLPLRRSFFRV